MRNPFLILAILIVSSISFLSCKTGGSGGAVKPSGHTQANPDTILTIIVFTPDGQSVNYSQVEKMKFDTIKYEFTDTVKNNKKELMQDSFYVLTVVKAIDSATSKKEGIPLLDSLGKPSLFAYKYVVPPAAVIWDANISLKDMILKKFPAKDSTAKPK